MKKTAAKGILSELRIKPEHALLVAIALFIVLFPLAAKPYIDTFSIGKSLARAYGFAAYLVLLAGASFFAPLLKRHLPKGIWKAQLALIGFLFLYGFFGQMHLKAELGNEPRSVLFLFDQQGYTVSSFWHNHVLKNIFCPFNPDQEDVDCARPIASHFPSGYFDIARAAWALAGFLSLLAYLRLEKPGDKAAYAILSFASLRTAVDGGLLSFDFVMFCMLTAFHIARENRLKATVAGLPIGFSIVTASSLLLGYMPSVPSNIFPMLMMLYPIALFFESPKRFYPLLALSFIAPFFLVGNDLVQDRWAPNACQNAHVDIGQNEKANGTIYTDCEAEAKLWCGNVSSFGGRVEYTGYKVEKIPILIAKALSQECAAGAFSIDSRNMTSETGEE
jgi:hypothetical protein